VSATLRSRPRAWSDGKHPCYQHDEQQSFQPDWTGLEDRWLGNWQAYLPETRTAPRLDEHARRAVAHTLFALKLYHLSPVKSIVFLLSCVGTGTSRVRATKPLSSPLTYPLTSGRLWPFRPDESLNTEITKVKKSKDCEPVTQGRKLQTDDGRNPKRCGPVGGPPQNGCHACMPPTVLPISPLLSSPCGESLAHWRLEIIPISPHIHVVSLDGGGAKSWRSSAGRPKKEKSRRSP
jgi:hypothetical protein